MSKIVLITGPRRSGKTHKALELARAAGLPFLALAPTMEVAREFSIAHPDVPVEVLVRKHPQAAGNVVLLAAHQLTAARFLDAAGCVIDRGGDVFIVASPPTDNASAWLLDLRKLPELELVEMPDRLSTPEERERFAELARIISPPRAPWAQSLHDAVDRLDYKGPTLGSERPRWSVRLARWLRRMFRLRPARRLRLREWAEHSIPPKGSTPIDVHFVDERPITTAPSDPPAVDPAPPSEGPTLPNLRIRPGLSAAERQTIRHLFGPEIYAHLTRPLSTK